MDKVKEGEMIYRKVLVKDRLPNEYDMFIVVSDLGQVSHTYFSLEYGKFEKQDVVIWFEPIPLPSLLVEREKEIEELSQKNNKQLEIIGRLAKELSELKSQLADRKEAVEFAVWLVEHGYECQYHQEPMWVERHDINQARLETSQLYNIFKERKK